MFEKGIIDGNERFVQSHYQQRHRVKTTAGPNTRLKRSFLSNLSVSSKLSSYFVCVNCFTITNCYILKTYFVVCPTLSESRCAVKLQGEV